VAALKSRSGNSCWVFIHEEYAELITALLTVLLIPDSWLSSTTSLVGLYAFFGLSNLALVWFQDDYFSPRAEFNPFVHTWSLGVEEQFYFVFPLLIFLWFRFHQCRAHTPLAAIINLLIPLLALASLYTAFYMGKTRPDWAYYMLPARFWELAAGVILFQLQAKRKIPELTGFPATAAAAGGLAMIAAGYTWSDVNAFPYPWAILPVLGTSMVIWGVSGTAYSPPGALAILTTAPSRYIGKISYSLYLWHWPIYTVMRWTTGIETAWLMLAAVTLTLIFATASYQLVETPVRQARGLATPAYRGVLAGLCAIVIFWAGAGFMFEHRHKLTLSSTGDTETWYPYAYPDTSSPPSRARNLEGRQLFVIGNSHTGAYATMVSLLEQRQGVRAQLLQTGHCALGNILYPIQALKGCEGTIENYLHLLHIRAKPGDMVFLASLRTHRLSDQWFRNDPAQVLADSQSAAALKKTDAAFNETSALVKRIGDMGLLVLIDAPKPVMKSPVYRCTDWFNQHNPVCASNPAVTRSFMESLRAPVVKALQRLSSENKHVYLWDPMPELCSNNLCPAYSEDGTPLYFDGDHLSAHGNRVLYPSFEQRVVNIYQECSACPKVARHQIPEFSRPIRIGQRITFNSSSPDTQYLGRGWSKPEHWGTWSEGRHARIYLPVVSKATIQKIRIEGHPLVSDAHQQQRVDIRIDGLKAGTTTLTARSEPAFEITLPESLEKKLETIDTLTLEIDLPNAVRPSEIGVNSDPRVLGLGLKSITLM